MTILVGKSWKVIVLLFLTIFAIALLSGPPLPGQAPSPNIVTAPHDAAQQTPILGLPPLELTLAEVISILADYDLRHSLDIRYFGYSGYVAYGNRLILIDDRTNHAFKKEIILHELLHIAYYRRNILTGDETGEKQIDRKAQELYEQLYGITVK